MSALNDPLLARQWHLEAINVFPVWNDHTGAGVLVGVADDGVQRRHPDLDANYDPRFAFDYRAGRPGGEPTRAGDIHGTAVAGLIAAEGDNSIGGAGVAFGASLTSLQIIPTGSPAEAFRDGINLDVINNSWRYGTDWAPFLDDFLNDPVLVEVESTLQTLVADGRGGLGTVVVFAAGNAREAGDDVNYHNLTNSRFTIAVAASDQDGNITYYSNPGAALLVTAPGGDADIVTTDRTGSAGYAPGDFAFDFAGTSAAAPILSGVVALMLQANPLLGYRDVQEILAYSARQTGGTQTWQLNGAGNWNGGGLHVSHDFGFGLVDAHAAVRLAETWTAGATDANETLISDAARFGPGLPIVDLSTVLVSLAMPALEIDHVEVVVDLRHSFVSDLIVRLISPDGTRSVLLDRAPAVADGTTTFDGSWRFSSTRHWGETAAGDWQLTIEDTAGGADTGILRGWELTLYGDPVDAHDVYVFTDEYAGYGSNARRSQLADPAGDDQINAAAVSGDLSIDLRPGATSEIAGQRLVIRAGTEIEHATGGDGDDRLAGNAAANALRGARGDDQLFGARGDDLLQGGPGNDQLLGGRGQDGLGGGPGNDHLSGARGDDLLHGGPGNDHLSGGRGNDRLGGGPGNDHLSGGRGADGLGGGPGADDLFGALGADRLTGGAGRDDFRYTAIGQRGDRILDFALGPAGDRLLIGELLEGFVEGVSLPGDFASLRPTGASTELRVDPDGQGPDIGLVTLAGIRAATLDGLIADGNLVLTIAVA